MSLINSCSSSIPSSSSSVPSAQQPESQPFKNQRTLASSNGTSSLCSLDFLVQAASEQYLHSPSVSIPPPTSTVAASSSESSISPGKRSIEQISLANSSISSSDGGDLVQTAITQAGQGDFHAAAKSFNLAFDASARDGTKVSPFRYQEAALINFHLERYEQAAELYEKCINAFARDGRATPVSLYEEVARVYCRLKR